MKRLLSVVSITCLVIFSSLIFIACNSNQPTFPENTINYNVNLYFTNTSIPDKSYTYEENSTVIVDSDMNSLFVRDIRQYYNNEEEKYYFFAGWYDNPDFTGNRISQLTISQDVNLYAKILTTYEALFDYFKFVETKTYNNVEFHYNEITQNVYIDVFQNDSPTGLEYQITFDGSACSYKYITTGSVWINSTVGVPPVGTILQIGNAVVDYKFQYNGRKCYINYNMESISTITTYNPYSLSTTSVKYLMNNSISTISLALPTLAELRDTLKFYTI